MAPSTNSSPASLATETERAQPHTIATGVFPRAKNEPKRTIPLRLAHHFANGRVHEATAVLSPGLPPSNIDIASGSLELHVPYPETPSQFVCNLSVWLGETRDDCNS